MSYPKTMYNPDGVGTLEVDNAVEEQSCLNGGWLRSSSECAPASESHPVDDAPPADEAGPPAPEEPADDTQKKSDGSSNDEND